MDNSLAGYHFLFAIFAFVLGAVVGSFLNVCIYRMPLDLSVNNPRRSFCPVCKAQLKWHQNIPLLSWLFLRGRCANCGSPIAFRYFVVELVTALFFLAVWLQSPGPIALAYWIFISLLIVGIFIDVEHFIIPDEVTIGGIVTGLLASFLAPALMRIPHHEGDPSNRAAPLHGAYSYTDRHPYEPDSRFATHAWSEWDSK